MATIIEGREIEKVGIIDDDDDGRETLGYTIVDSCLTPLRQTEPVSSISQYVDFCITNMDAIVSDHHLTKHGSYFPENGAAFISRFYQKIPTVLVTNYEQPDILEIRKYRRYIPTVLKGGEFNPDTFLQSLGMCIKEFQGEFSYERKTWRSLIRIDDFDASSIYLIVPGWDTNEKISLNKADLPPDVQILVHHDMRLYAKVNIGAQRSQDLYFTDWELIK